MGRLLLWSDRKVSKWAGCSCGVTERYQNGQVAQRNQTFLCFPLLLWVVVYFSHLSYDPKYKFLKLGCFFMGEPFATPNKFQNESGFLQHPVQTNIPTAMGSQVFGLKHMRPWLVCVCVCVCVCVWVGVWVGVLYFCFGGRPC